MTHPPDIDPKGACLCDTWPPAPHCPTHPDRGGQPMSDRLTDGYLDWLEGLHAAATPGPWRADGPNVRANAGDVCYDADDIDAETIATAHNALPALLAEVREHRAREVAHRAALDALVDGDGR